MDGVTGGQVFEGDALEGHGSSWIRVGCLGSLSRGDKTGLFWLFWLLWKSWLPCHEGCQVLKLQPCEWKRWKKEAVQPYLTDAVAPCIRLAPWLSASDWPSHWLADARRWPAQLFPGSANNLSESEPCSDNSIHRAIIRQSIPPQLFAVSISPAGSLPFAQSMSLWSGPSRPSATPSP
jgi:hypothetical protein